MELFHRLVNCISMTENLIDKVIEKCQVKRLGYKKP